MEEQPSEEQIEAITDALASGKKIEAIKIYRESTGKGLKEAKEFVDALIPKLVEHDPERFAKISKAGGCSSMFLLAAAIACLSVVWILI